MNAGRPHLDLSVLRTLYRYELKMLLRDRRTLLIAVIAPLILFPAIILLMRWVEQREQAALDATTFRYAVTGSEAALARTLLEEAFAPTVPASDRSASSSAPDDATSANVALVQDAARFEEVRLEGTDADPDSLLEAGDLHLVIEGLSAEEHQRERERERQRAREREGDRGRAETGTANEAGEPVQQTDEAKRAGARRAEPLIPMIRLHYRGDGDRSSRAATDLADRLGEVRESRRDRVLAEAGFPVPAQVAPVESHSLASAEEEGGALLALFLTPLLVMLMLSGGSIVAVDAIAGEKERGTLEALLTTGARRGEIVASKQLAVITVGVAIAVINVVNLLAYLGIGLLEVPERLAAVALGPAALIVLLLLFLPVAVLVSSALLLLSGYSKSYKEYQVYFFPVFLLFLLPSLAAVLPGLELRSLIVLAPLANVSVAVREVLTGTYDWAFLALAFLITSGVALWATRLTSRSLSTERLITAAELERADLTGGPALFPRRVLRWFAILWALLLTTSLWMGMDVGIRGQVAFNLLGLFLGGTILMLWRYRLDPRQALALRMPPAASWLAVLIGAPSALITGVGLAQLVDVVLPVPESMVESFGQYLLPEDLPFAQIVLFLCLLPGICEELAFRGVLLHGLRRRFSPVALVFVVGAVFGLFHVSLFRLIPTGYLGAVLAAVVLLTGSIFPAMLWHTLNNAAALLPAYFGWWAGEAPPGWSYPIAFVGLALSFGILWRNRSPYPGLRSAPARIAAPVATAGPS